MKSKSTGLLLLLSFSVHAFEIDYIPLSQNMKATVRVSDIQEKAFAKFEYSSKKLNVLFDSASRLCKKNKRNDVDHRVRIKGPKIALYIDSGENFFTENKLCQIDPNLKSSVIKEIQDKYITVLRDKEFNPSDNYFPIFE